MKPRSVTWTPHSARPMFSVFTARPAAMSTATTSILRVAPFASTSRVTLSLAGPLFHLGTGDHLDASLLVALRQSVRRFGVLERQDPRQRLDQRHGGTERAENVGELHADGSSADDRQRGRRLLEEEGLVRGNDGRLVDLQPDLRQALYARSRRDDHGLLLFVRIAPDLHLASRQQYAAAFDHGDLVLLHQELDTLRV